MFCYCWFFAAQRRGGIFRINLDALDSQQREFGLVQRSWPASMFHTIVNDQYGVFISAMKQIFITSQYQSWPTSFIFQTAVWQRWGLQGSVKGPLQMYEYMFFLSTSHCVHFALESDAERKTTRLTRLSHNFNEELSSLEPSIHKKSIFWEKMRYLCSSEEGFCVF